MIQKVSGSDIVESFIKANGKMTKTTVKVRKK